MVVLYKPTNPNKESGRTVIIIIINLLFLVGLLKMKNIQKSVSGKNR